jgi:hypothetical protein
MFYKIIKLQKLLSTINTTHLINTWIGQFYCYGDQQVLSLYLEETIMSNKKLINHGRR